MKKSGRSIQISESLVVALVILGIMALALEQAIGFNAKARQMPLIIGIPTFVLAVLVVVGELTGWWRRAGGEGQALSSTPESGDDGASVESGESIRRREFGIIAWLLVWVGIVMLFGLTWGTPVFLVTFLRLYSHLAWWRVLAISLGTWGAIYVLFVLLLGLQMYDGLVPSLLL